MILYHFRIYRRAQPLQVAITGRTGLLEHGHAAASVGAAGPLQGLRAWPEQQTPPPILLGLQYFPGITGRTDQRADYDGVYRGTRTTRSRDLPGSGPKRQSDARD